jgi:ribosome assembly protein RRB1
LTRLVRTVSNPPSPVAHFTWHTAPITSIEWHPLEDSVFAASGSDDQVTLWDLSVEQDEDEVGTKEIHTANGQKACPYLSLSENPRLSQVSLMLS